jgi:hypothetical protein
METDRFPFQAITFARISSDRRSPGALGCSPGSLGFTLGSGMGAVRCSFLLTTALLRLLI